MASGPGRPAFGWSSGVSSRIGLVDGSRQLDEDAAAGFRVQEADHAGDAASRGLVDELDALRFERLQFGIDIGRLEADVVEAFAFALEEAADGRVGPGGLEELDFAGADGEEGRLNTLVLDGVLSVDVEAERVTVEEEGLVKG